MLPSLTKAVLENKQKILSKLDNTTSQKIIDEAKKNWIEYKPQKLESESKIAGVDSSFNRIRLQGFDFWAVQAVAVDSSSRVLSYKEDYDLSAPNKINVNKKASDLEITVSKQVAKNLDYVIVDGSLTSHFAFREYGELKLDPKLIKTVKDHPNIIFLAKTSSSVHQFKKMNAPLADIAYYNRLNKIPGFSKISIDERFGEDQLVTYVYARIDDSLGLFKLELYGTNHSEKKIKTILNQISSNCVKGYPYCLKQAHNKCNIKDIDMRNFKRILGLTNEFGSRDIMEA